MSNVATLRNICIAAMVIAVSGCNGGSQSGLASVGPSAAGASATDGAAMLGMRLSLAQAIRPTLRADREKSWVARSARTQPTLMYVTNIGNGTVTMYTWNLGGGLALQGTITGFTYPTQPCADGRGNIYIPDQQLGTVTEFAYGGMTPIRTLQAGNPTGCSVDRSHTGNLAVANFGNGNVLVYPNGSGSPTSYTVPGVAYPQYAGYDSSGDLYVDGQPAGGPSLFAMAVLPNGSGSFTPLTIAGGSIVFPGNVEWGGTFLLVGDQGFAQTGSSINQVTVSGSTATIVNNRHLFGSRDVVGFWRRGPSLAAWVATADIGNNQGQVFTWPGGELYNVIRDSISYPYGAIVIQRGRGAI